MKHLVLVLAPLFAMIAAPASATTPDEIVDAAPDSEWREIAPADLLVMTLAPDAAGKPREVVVQLLPEPFSAAWTRNVRALAKANWWNGTSIYRSVDNWVVQWGEGPVEEGKTVPAAMGETSADGYSLDWRSGLVATLWDAHGRRAAEAADKERDGSKFGDPYAAAVGYVNGMPVASDLETRIGPDGAKISRPTRIWPVHCYASVGVARALSPDAGSGTELYAVIGHAPRQLDRNIAVVGKVIDGIEHLSILPRGTGPAGVYETEGERTPIVSVRLLSEMPVAARPRYRVLDTDGDSFARYAEVKANRDDAFYTVPAGGADVCNVAAPVKRFADDASG
ncbi:peptidylprolyl isomerase [Croceicoccus ponticola]|uniref:Peptidylprolyl isomerase n=1 Tax=Croceicoccus ponticola TaxID=2217664 RepID=A0A437GUT8_9SPHN|nr:peptidylprolyl isomerase [Croceicoccus ponticola]RVQ65306.1 peptidylprolyl isomerase [Croceicoccus ponticola]